MPFICAWRVRTTHGMHGFQFGGLLIKLGSANFTKCREVIISEEVVWMVLSSP